jgi:pyrroline-5-carboxylate reductase
MHISVKREVNMDESISIIGTGNMGGAIVKGLTGSSVLPAEKIYIFDVNEESMAKLAAETGVNAAKSCAEAVRKSRIIILAVKPDKISSVLEPVKELFDSDKILVSIAVGIPVKAYRNIIGHKSKIVRAMPNTPALVNKGMTLISYDDLISENEAETVKRIFESVGRVERLPESLMNEVTALTGSSPAYVFMFIEAMADAAVLSGIPRDMAYRLAAQAVYGSASMVLETGKHPGELKDQVCSPAGTTIEAVKALEKNGFRYSIIEAMEECTKKAREISSRGQ